MKKFAVLILTLFVGLNIYAQSDDQKVRFGIVANPGLSWLKPATNGQDRNGVDLAFGYGLHIEFRMGKYFALSTGVSQANYHSSVTFADSVNFTYSITEQGQAQPPVTSQILERAYVFNSIEVPLRLKMKTAEIGYITYWIEAGISTNVNYKVTARDNKIVTASGTSTLTDDLEKIDVNDETNWYRAGTVLGGGIEYNLFGNTSLLIGVHWSSAFTSALKDEAVNLTYIGTNKSFQQKAKLDFLNLTVGLLF